MVARFSLSILGSAAMIVGAFLTWFRIDAPAGAVGVPESTGIDLSWSIFYSTADPFGASFYSSAGVVAIALGVVALLGLAFRSGWLTRIAGALGIVAVVLFAITLFRVPGQDFGLGEIGVGAWLAAGGGLVALIGGFFGTRSAMAPAMPGAPPPPPAPPPA